MSDLKNNYLVENINIRLLQLAELMAVDLALGRAAREQVHEN